MFVQVVVEDQRQELVEDFVWPAVAADLVFEDRYLLGTALARPCIVRGLIRVAKRVGAGKHNIVPTKCYVILIRFTGVFCYSLWAAVVWDPHTTSSQVSIINFPMHATTFSNIG